MKATRLREAARRVMDERIGGIHMAAKLNPGPEYDALHCVFNSCIDHANASELSPDLRCMLLLLAAEIAERP